MRDPTSLTSSPEAAASPSDGQDHLYALAYAWSTRINSVFTMLEAAEKILVSGNQDRAALPLLRVAMEQISDCDDESTLLNALARVR